LKSFDGSQSDFLGQEITPSRVLYVTEEDETIWAGRRDALMIGNYVGMWCRPFKMRPTMQEWRDHINKVVEQVKKHQFDLVVFDTLSKMWPVREENDAGQVEEALMPLWNLSNLGVTILLVHHMRKSEGEQFVGARGSGGLPAFVDVLMEFRRSTANPKETKRIIHAMGRYSDTPVKLLCELQSGRYVGLGDPDDADVKAANTTADWQEDLWSCLEETGEEWKTATELSEALKVKRNGKAVRKSDLLSVINKLFESGELERNGEGRNKNPFIYRIPQMDEPMNGSAP